MIDNNGLQYQPVIIIGAPRSGTNMLRDVLTHFPGVATWPCDEINYIWRHGNVRYPSDEFTTDMARPEVKKYIRGQFDWVARKYQAQTVVEKTCANSLRVEFVDHVVPEAKYIFIRRDGFDAVGSAMKRWKASLDIPYLARKARFVPLSDLPYYATRFIYSRLHRLFSREGRLGLWGPQLKDLDRLLATHSLEEVCAIQWRRCVEASANAFASMPADKWIEVGYEDFVRDPQAELKRLLHFVCIEPDSQSRAKAVSGVSAVSVGKGREFLGEETINRLQPLIQGASQCGGRG